MNHHRLTSVSSETRPAALMLRAVLCACMLGVLADVSIVGAQAPKGDPTALAQQAVAALEGLRFGDALTAFTEASKLVPRDPSLCVGAGVAALRLGQNADAEGWFQRALKLDPAFIPASQWLGELQYSEGRIKEAITTYETALKQAPHADTLERRLDDWRKEARLQERFYESRGAHFVVLFEGPADEALARRVVERLENAYWRIGGVLTAYPAKPITVVLYTSDQFRDITRLPEWTAAAYDGRIRLPIRGALAQTDELDRVLSHEFVHAVVGMLGGRNVPVWVNEGLAVALEPGEANDADDVMSRARTRPALKDLHRSFSGLSAFDARLAYAVSTHAVRRMMALRGPYAVVALLQDLARGVEFSSAFQQRIAMRYEDFQVMVARD